MIKLRKTNQTLTKGLSHEIETGNGLASRFEIKEFINLVNSKFRVESEYHNTCEIILNKNGNDSFNGNDTNADWEKVLGFLHDHKFKPKYVNGVHQSGHHVHYDVSHLTPVQIANIYTSFYQYQEVILLAVGSSRYENHDYVNKLTKTQAEKVYTWAKAWQLGSITRERFMDEISGHNWKFYILSTNQLANYSTLEARFFGLPLVYDCTDSKKESINRFIFNGEFFKNLCEYFARFKRLQKVTEDLPKQRLTTRHLEDVEIEYSKKNRFSPKQKKGFKFSFNTIFRNACESERLYNHMKKRVQKVISYRNDLNHCSWYDKESINEIIENHKW